ncbi:AbgT family transporter [Arthrobacter sp. YC-RL1]|nr:AbgT family transporter [Arthrobacter sp. YC-RL1]
MSQVQDTRTNGRAMATLLKFINFVERLVNMLPHPFWLFWVMALLLGVVS